jgi:aminoglycoside 6-adenylyltransferase
MRSEQEMLDLILETARRDERIRAVVMNGSRANPNAPRDRFQDFDIAYFVTDVEPYKNNFEWIQRFGEIMIMQMPEDMQDPPPEGMGSWVYLMQFMDGNRIDLGIDPLNRITEITADSQTVVLLDKDGLIPTLPPSSDRDYLPQPPTVKTFEDCCNEFWWVSAYVAKGLWRKEILYAKYYLDHYVRDQLMKMLDWVIGVRTQFTRNPGKYGKYVRQFLEPEQWELLLKTYSDADYEHTWEALYVTCALFRQLALEVAGHFGYAYPHEDDERMSAHLEHVRYLPGKMDRADDGIFHESDRPSGYLY